MVVLLLVVALQPLLAQARFEGVASCAGSTCHGRSEGNGAVVRQDELLRWQDPSSPAGAHSRAYSVLSGRRGQQIVASLGLDNEGRARACLGCHATNAPPALRGGRFQLNEGVGCESCHGASSGWLETHYTVPATERSNVALGMTELDNPQKRARVCLGCHLGSDEPGQFVSHRMMAAGHPRISFELDLFSALQQHHDEDAKYARRKPRTDNVRLWAVGQAEAIRRSLSLFANPRFGSEGIFPEFTFYDCHSCHREIDDKGERTRTFEVNPGRPIPLGMPPYQDENIIMLSVVAKALAPGEAARFDAASRSFHAAMGSGRSAAIAAGARLDSAASELSNELTGKRYGGDAAFTVIDKISSQAIAARFTDYEGSVQAVMAVDTLLNALVREGRVTVGAAAGIRVQVNRAYAAVSSPRSYNPPAFRAALGQAARSIGALK
ncbi:MAG TPA: multiheme c-type cytochrome [Novosphingobium sp.]|nr:multiheme c-type cytochrome [Novosphingobium sp.]